MTQQHKISETPTAGADAHLAAPGARMPDTNFGSLPGSLVRLAPWLVIGYIAALFVLRLTLSPFVEWDEAQFPGNVHLALTYGNSHPPLFNWLVRGALEATGWNWPIAVGLVKYTLLMGFHLLTWDTARRLAGPAAGLMALAVSGLAPHIVGTSALSLSHSIMVITAVAATTHATVMVVQSGRIWAFVELGAAVTLGVLAKYNYFLFLIPFLGALVLDRSTRRAIVRPGLALSAAMVVAACTLPLVAAANDIAGTTERVAKLYEATKGWRSAIDIPGLGVDGAVFFVEALAGWAGLAVVVWMVARAFDRRRDGAPPPTAPAPAPIHALGVAMVAGLVIFLVGVLAADVSLVRGRYLTPMLASLPVWLAVARPLGRSAPIVARAAGAIYLTVPIVFAGVVLAGLNPLG